MRVLVTGATGYIGGRLIPRLLERGHTVRVLVRDPRRVAGRPWAGDVEIVKGDLLDPASILRAVRDVDAAYYLVHSMASGRDFADRDEQAAALFANLAQTLRRVIYLGGLLGDEESSEHLRSRAAVGKILRASVPTLEFRAGPIVGSGSASFEIVRYLTERLPAMIAPRWIRNLVQPIAVRDVLAYLVAALDNTATGVVEIGADRLTFKEMMLRYAEVRGLRRTVMPVPVLAPRLAALWVGLVTPVTNRIALPLIEGVVSSVVADTTRATILFPDINPIDYRFAVASALRSTDAHEIETRWSGAVNDAATIDLVDEEGLMREVRQRPVDAAPHHVFRVFTSLGGDSGWRVWNGAWRLRGFLDRIVGGPGLRRGRRDPGHLLPGEAVDFWRVEQVVPDRLLRLRAEMKLPGRAWLQWEVVGEGRSSRLIQTALFEPRGLAGAIYWWALYPLHRKIFSDLATWIGDEAEVRSTLLNCSGRDREPLPAAAGAQG